MEFLTDIFATAQPQGRQSILTADSFSGPRPANSRPVATFRQTAGKPETRQYKAVFFLGKSEIGLPSAVVIAIAAP